MEKEFIPYEQALALKELGFDGKCLAGFYTYADENLVLNKYDYRGKFNINYSGDDDYIINTNKEYYVSAPLFSQVFRWFRDKHSLQCFPMQDSIDIWWCLFSKDVLSSGYLLKDGDYGHYSDEHLEFNTYEEAELECLKKLIKTVKELAFLKL